jgi:hypothetical protein
MSVNAHAKRAYKTDNRTLDADRRETRPGCPGLERTNDSVLDESENAHSKEKCRAPKGSTAATVWLGAVVGLFLASAGSLFRGAL